MHIMTKALVALVGVALATPSFAQASNSRDIPCPSMPPPSIVTESREGAVGLQVFDIGVSANRGRVRSEQEVIIQTRGTEAYLDVVMYKQACEAVRLQYPGNPSRQFQELMRFRADNKRAEAAAQLPLPLIDLTPAPSEAALPKEVKSTTTVQRPEPPYSFDTAEARALINRALGIDVRQSVEKVDLPAPAVPHPRQSTMLQPEMPEMYTANTVGNCSLMNPTFGTWIQTGTLSCNAPNGTSNQNTGTYFGGVRTCVPRAATFIPANMIGSVFIPAITIPASGEDCTTRF